jgi:hypothetical protein
LRIKSQGEDISVELNVDLFRRLARPRRAACGSLGALLQHQSARLDFVTVGTFEFWRS